MRRWIPIAKMVPAKIPNVKIVTIDKAMEVNPDLKKAYNEQPDIRHLLDMAKRLEGLPRHASMHAAGVVISQKDVSEYVPLSRHRMEPLSPSLAQSLWKNWDF